MYLTCGMPDSCCSTCGVRPVDDRSPSSVRRGKCVECYRDYMRDYMRERRGRLDLVEGRTRAERLALRQELAGSLGGACRRCGWRPSLARDWGRLHFHHRDPATKAFAVAPRLPTASVEALRAEVAKCDLLCWRCHRDTHGGTPTGELALAVLADGEAWTVAALVEVVHQDPRCAARTAKQVSASVRTILDQYARRGLVVKIAPGTYQLPLAQRHD